MNAQFHSKLNIAHIRAIAIYSATTAIGSARRHELGIIASRSTLRANSEVGSEAAKRRESVSVYSAAASEKNFQRKLHLALTG